MTTLYCKIHRCDVIIENDIWISTLFEQNFCYVKLAIDTSDAQGGYAQIALHINSCALA